MKSRKSHIMVLIGLCIGHLIFFNLDVFGLYADTSNTYDVIWYTCFGYLVCLHHERTR